MRKGRPAIRTQCLVLALASFASLRAFAESPKARADEQKRLVVAVPEASTGLLAEELVTALRGQLSEMGVEVVLSRRPLDVPSETSPAAAQQNALALVWLVREGEVLGVHFFESDGATLRQRRLPLHGTDAASLEEVALVVRSAVSALLERHENEQEPAPHSEHGEATPESVEETPSPKSAHPSASREALFWLGLGWVGQSYAPEVPVSHGVQVAVGARPTRGNFGLGFSYQLLPAQIAASDQVSVTLWRHPLETLIFWQAAAGDSPVFFGGEVGVMMDILRRSTVVSVPELSPNPDTTRFSWALAGRALFGVRLGRQISLRGNAGADLLAERVSVVLDDGQVLLRPHRVRPRLSALLSWNFP